MSQRCHILGTSKNLKSECCSLAGDGWSVLGGDIHLRTHLGRNNIPGIPAPVTGKVDACQWGGGDFIAHICSRPF